MKGPHDKRGSLPLEAMAARGSSHDKLAFIQKQKQKKLLQKMKQKKLLHKLEAGGRAPPAALLVKDNIAELEHELFTGDVQQPPVQDVRPKKKAKRSQSAAELPADRAEDTQEPQQQAIAAGHRDGQQAGRMSRKHMTTAGMSMDNRQKQKTVGQHTATDDDADEEVDDLEEQAQHGKPHRHQQSEQSGKDRQQQVQRQGRREKDVLHKGRMKRLLDQQQEQREAARQAKQKAQEARAQHQARVQAVQKQRSEEKKRFFKRTRTGQPLMQYRIEKILNQLQHE